MDPTNINFIIENIQYTDEYTFYDKDKTYNCSISSIPIGPRKIRYITFKNLNLEIGKIIPSLIAYPERVVYPDFCTSLSSVSFKPDHYELTGITPIENRHEETTIHDKIKDTKEVRVYKSCKCTVDSYTAVTVNRVYG